MILFDFIKSLSIDEMADFLIGVSGTTATAEETKKILETDIEKISELYIKGVRKIIWKK